MQAVVRRDRAGLRCRARLSGGSTYLERSDKKGSPDHISSMGKAEVIIAKQRHGPTGTANLAFNGAYTKFSDLPEVATQ